MLQFDHWTGYKIELIFGLVVVIATKVKNIIKTTHFLINQRWIVILTDTILKVLKEMDW